MSKVIDDYAEVVDSLYEWYSERFYEYHYPTLMDLQTLAKEYREVSEKLEPGGLPPHDPEADFIDPEAKSTPKPPSQRSRNRSKNQKRKKR